MYKRTRESLKYKRDETLFTKAKKELETYQKLAKQGDIKLLYADESGFAGNLPVNYSWTKKGQQKHIDKKDYSSIKTNVLGLYDYAKEELAYSLTQSKMDSEMFISLFNITKPESNVPICVVIDNYSIHTSSITKKNIIEWEKEGIYLYFLPPYSPELNLIENKWNILKHHAIKKRNFDDSHSLELAISEGVTKLNNKTR